MSSSPSSDTSSITESLSSSSSSVQSQASSSSSSSSSWTDVRSTSSASSSSQSRADTAPSQLVLLRVARNENFAIYTVVVDLSVMDEHAVEFCGKPRIDPGGVFNGYAVRHQSLPIKDGLRMALKIEPRQDLDQEALIYHAWQQHLLSQLRAGLKFARDEAEILGIQAPQHYRGM